MAAAFNGTLEDPSVTVEPTYTNCIVCWNPCDKADRYRFDLYRVENHGPAMRSSLNHVMMQSEWTVKTEINPIELNPMTTYRCAVFAFKGETFIGRYGEWSCIRVPMDRQAFVNAFMEAATRETRIITRQALTKKTFVNKNYWRQLRLGYAELPATA